MPFGLRPSFDGARGVLDRARADWPIDEDRRARELMEQAREGWPLPDDDDQDEL
nr:hypothetical protein [Micromonospora sp. DSM 115978]